LGPELKAGNSLEIINTKNYHYQNKSEKFILFSKKNADSIIYESFYISAIYKIRVNNFSDDMNLNPSELNESYSNYDVSLVEKSNNLYLIKQKQEYDYARAFTRFIKFDSESVQQCNLTINDFAYADIDITKTGYIIALNDFGRGAANLFNNVHYSYRVVWLDENLNIVGDFHIAMQGTNINSVSYSKGKYYAVCELHTGCDMCDWDFCFFEIEFDSKYQPKNIKIIQQPKSQIIDSKRILQHIKSNRIVTLTDLLNRKKNN